MTVRETIYQFIIKDVAHGESIADDTDLIEGGVYDSLGMVTTTTFIEDQFGIQIKDEEIETHLRSIDAITAFVESRL